MLRNPPTKYQNPP